MKIRNRCSGKILCLLVFIISMCVIVDSKTAYANSVPLNGSVQSWRIENYVSSQVVIWFSGSSCNTGALILPSTATTEDKNRLWATVLAAKLNNHNMFVFYDDSASPNSCVIISFGID